MHARFGAATVAALALFALVPGATASEQMTQAATPAGTPTYDNYAAPAALGNNAGEPSIGVDRKTGKVFFQSNVNTYRVSFDGCSSPARATWEDKTAPTSAATLDPILFCDPNTGSHPNRVFASQLSGTTSLMSFSDDGGETWQPSQGGGIASGVDHQTVGGGPFHAPLTRDPNGSEYPNAVYYCSQDVADAACGVSLDGGQTFGPAVPIWTIADCGGLHGHVKVAPNDGTAYVPEKACPSTLVSPTGHQAVAVSESNGATWSVRPVTTSTRGDTDPSVGIANDGTVYFGYDANDDHARIAVSHDHGQTWEHDTDVGAQLGVVATEFAGVVAGDADRAAFAFLGSTTSTPTTNPAASTQIWHLYVATTFDGGQTWTTVDATPNDPVQRGWICVSGTTCSGNRNLLDFNDINVDAQGRVLVAYADGCVGSCVSGGPNSFTAKAAIARQTGGKRLFAQFDPPATSLPGAPRVDAARDTRVVHLSWVAPYDGGSPLTSYRISRSTSSTGGFASLATVTEPGLDDFGIDSATAYYYRVTAVNGTGEGPYCQIQVNPGVTQTESACRAPGVTIYDDNTGDAVDQIAGHDVQRLSVAEPFLGAGVSKLVFTLKVRSLATVPPNTTWPIGFVDQNGGPRCVAMWSDVAANVRFVFGSTASCAQSPTAVVAPLDSASNYNADGTITLVLPDSALGISPGQTLTNFITRVRVEGQASAITPDNMPDGVQAGQRYTLVGNAACAPNNRPTARLAATPSSGFAPLSVTLDGAGSSDPDGEAISSYTFDFGDGSALVRQSTPTVSHTYANPGAYNATLTVKDARGLDSGNVAAASVQATTSADIAVAIADSPDPVKKDKPLTYTVTVRNGGPFAASGVTMSDPLPTRVELGSAKTTQGTCRSAKAGQAVTVNCSLGNLASGAVATVTIVVKRLQAGTLRDTASAGAASPADPNPSNNSATAATTVVG